jgi:hypothetical protein
MVAQARSANQISILHTQAPSRIPDNGGSCGKVSKSVILHLIPHRQKSVVRKDCTGATRSWLLFLPENLLCISFSMMAEALVIDPNLRMC